MTTRFFKDEFAFLSNFWPVSVEYEGMLYTTVEHAYQAAKTFDPGEQLHVASQPTPGRAKRAGRSITLREDWDAVKNEIMYGLLIEKFGTTAMRDRLLLTGTVWLVEGNYWHDLYWGCCFCGRHRGEGRNELGHILMKVRKEKQKEGGMYEV